MGLLRCGAVGAISLGHDLELDDGPLWLEQEIAAGRVGPPALIEAHPATPP